MGAPMFRVQRLPQPCDLVGVPRGIGHGQAVVGHLAFHGQDIGVIVDARRDLRPELDGGGLGIGREDKGCVGDDYNSKAMKGRALLR